MNGKSLFNTDFSIKRLMTALVLIPLLVYLGLAVLVYFFADKLIFQPPPAFVEDDAATVQLATPSGEKIAAKFHPHPDAKATILFSHGNAEDIFGSGPFFERLRDAGFNVLAYDYRGYGASDGAPSERNVYEDAETAYRYLTDELKIPAGKIILHGRSLGGAVAVELAARQPCGGLIVESSFVSAFRVLTRVTIFPFDRFESLDKIKRIRCPVLFIHGRRDELVHFRHGEALFAAAPEPKFFYAVEAAAHNDLAMRAGDAYWQRIRDFADNLPK